MTRNLKGLGLALAAAFVMSAVAASAAQAETHLPIHLTPTAYPAILTGHQAASEAHPEHKFKPELGSISCKSATFDGTIESAAKNTEITIQPTYKECKMTVGASSFPVTVEMTHCDYLFTEGTEVTPHEFNKGQVSLVCPNVGETPHVTSYNNAGHTEKRCEFTVTPFVHKGENIYTNVTPGTGKKDVTITSKVEGIKVDRTFGSLFQCGLAEQTATYTGTTTLQAYKDLGVDLLTQTPTTYNYTEGEQYDLTVSK